MSVLGICSALRAGFRHGRDRTLQAAGLFEAAMSSLFHERLLRRPGRVSHGERHAECTRRRAAPVTGPGPGFCPTTVLPVTEDFDPLAMIERFRSRAVAVRGRGIPPIEGPERQRFVEQAQQDFMDYAMLGDADATLVDGILTLRIDLRPEGSDGGGSD